MTEKGEVGIDRLFRLIDEFADQLGFPLRNRLRTATIKQDRPVRACTEAL
jgi:hypothetical protein